MNRKERITSNDNQLTAMMKLSGGNPGALSVVAQLLERGAVTDPDDAFGGLGKLLSLDTFGIYESRIWMLHKDVCGQDLAATCGLLRAVQLGFLSREKLNHAIDHYGDGIDLSEIRKQVVGRLPNFQWPERATAHAE